MQNKKTISDILGPVMIGPSSSHTAGAVRLGLLARRIFGAIPNKVSFTLYNSFAKTGSGHGTQNALTAGILGYDTDAFEIKDSFLIADKNGLKYSFSYVEDYNRHPNSVDILLSDENLTMLIKGSSIGAGEVLIDEIDGYSFNIKGDYETLLLMYKDTPGMVYRVANLIQSANINIAQMNCGRCARGKGASMGICLDSHLPDKVFDLLKNLDDVYLIRLIERLKS